MQTLFIGFVEDSVHPGMKSIAIRIAYLLSAQFRLSGNVSFHFDMEEGFKLMSYEQKLHFIDDRYKNIPGAESFYQLHKEFIKLKKRAKEKEYIVAKKKAEKIALDHFNTEVVRMMKIVNETGLPALKAMEESAAFGEYYISHTYPESENINNSKLSEVLQLNLDENDNKAPTLFVLSNSFFAAEFDIDNVLIELNNFSEKGFLQELFTFPNYIHFSVADLNAIRFETSKSLEAFQLSVNSFAALSASPAEAFSHLQNDVLPAAKKIAEDINSTAIVTNYNTLMSGISLIGKLYLGLLPRYVVFKYFEFVKASTEPTIIILDQLPEEERHQLVPVLIVLADLPDTMKTVIGNNEHNESMPIKKTLSID